MTMKLITRDNGLTYTDPGTVTAVHVDTAAPAYGQTVTGYGPKIPTRYRLTMADGRTRRVYVMCYGNSGSLYVTVAGAVAHLDTGTEHALETARDAA